MDCAALGIFFLGAKKLPELSRSLGQAMSEFKKGVATGAQDGPAPEAVYPKTQVASDSTKAGGNEGHN
jgi:TatA/E family protein of Tat protein translocase